MEEDLLEDIKSSLKWFEEYHLRENTDIHEDCKRLLKRIKASEPKTVWIEKQNLEDLPFSDDGQVVFSTDISGDYPGEYIKCFLIRAHK